jgi:hypothetical protein
MGIIGSRDDLTSERREQQAEGPEWKKPKKKASTELF